jgi:hypothetical protein
MAPGEHLGLCSPSVWIAHGLNQPLLLILKRRAHPHLVGEGKRGYDPMFRGNTLPEQHPSGRKELAELLFDQLRSRCARHTISGAGPAIVTRMGSRSPLYLMSLLPTLFYPLPSLTEFGTAHIYAAPLHMVLTSMLQEIAKGSEAPYRTEAMQDPGYGLPRTPLPGTWVNKLPVNAPSPAWWHHAWCRPLGKTRVGKEVEPLCR